MSRGVYEEVHKIFPEADIYFLHNPDALGNLGTNTNIKITATLRQRSYSVVEDGVVETC